MASESRPEPRRPSGRYVRQPDRLSRLHPGTAAADAARAARRCTCRRLLSRGDRALGRLDGSIQTLPNPDLFVFMYVRKEAVLSSQIEGTQSSLQDLLAAEAQVLGARPPARRGRGGQLRRAR